MRAVGAVGMLGKAGAVRSDVAEAASRAPGSPLAGAASAAAPVDVEAAVAGPRVVRAAGVAAAVGSTTIGPLVVAVCVAAARGERDDG